jgi:uncharacterized protein (DUF1330 family)
MDDYKKYAEKVFDIVTSFGGKYLVRGGDVDILEGQPSGNRNVIIEFEDKAKALSFYNSEEYQKIIKHRTDNSNGYITIVDGLA